GHPPFQGSPSVIQEAHRSAVPPPLAADVPSAARAALERMLAKAPADRFPTAAAFVDGLRGAIPSGVPVGPTGSGATVLEQDAALAPAGGGASDGNSAVASGDRKGVIKPTGARLA